MQAEEKLKEQIVNILKDVPAGLTSRRINSLTSNVGVHLVTACLRHLQSTGHVRLTHGTVWQWTGRTYVSLPPQTPKGRGHEGESLQISRPPDNAHAVEDNIALNIPKNTRWNEFRHLCMYYSECIRLEDKAKVHSYADNEGRDFISLTDPLSFQTLALGGSLRCEIKKEWAQFLQKLHRPKSIPRFYIGYPVHVSTFKDKSNGDTKQRISPIFVQQVECPVIQDTIEIRAAGPVEVNNDWLEGRFKRSEDRYAFLEQMGLYNSSDGDSQFLKLDFEALSGLLYTYYPDDFREYPNLSSLDQNNSFSDVLETGFYNRVVLISQKKLKYTERLYKELVEIAQKEDDKLDDSALTYLFNHNPPPTSDDQLPSNQEANSSSLFNHGLAEYEPMDEKQRLACRHALSAPLTVINGPPGTGKSRVVAQIMANAALSGQTVLFASKNHQAIAAVVPRLNQLVEPDMLVISTARQQGSEDAMNLAKALIALLDTPRPTDLETNLKNAMGALYVSMECLDQTEAQRKQFFELYHALDCEQRTLSAFLKSLPEYADEIEKLPDTPPEHLLTKAIESLRPYCTRPSAGLKKWLWKISQITNGKAKYLRAIRLERSFCEALNESISAPISINDTQALNSFINTLEKRRKISQAINLARKVQGLRRDVSNSLGLQQCHQEYLNSHETVQLQTENTLKLLAKSFGIEISSRIREDFAGIRGFLQIESQLTENQKRNLEKALDTIFPKILKHMPLWATTNLSVGRSIPLVAGSFDLVIIDESSQCDIASVIPLLYRAKRIAVAGDPMQLPHVSSIKGDVAARSLEKYGFTDMRFGRYLYPTNSFYDLASSSNSLTNPPATLQSHHRSHPAIAEYCNEIFYGGTLQVMTNLERIHAPTVSGKQIQGFQWTDVPADAEPIGGSGVISRGQIEAIIEELYRLRKDHFPGTIGVVTPFRSQANRIRDRVHQEFGPEIPNHWRFHAATADGYQGDERDVMFLSIPCGELPRGSRWFLETKKNRFNVAVSRARAVLHVVSDKAWCRNSGITHVEKLAEFALDRYYSDQYVVREDLIGPVWEPKLAAALDKAGIYYLQQYPACGRYLDFAILRKNLKLNIEVDGEAYHRTIGGERKIDDLNRDLVLIANGWKIIRFWVYQLREDIQMCIQTIRSAIEETQET